MTYGATKAEFADRIDKLNDLVEAEREMRASMTKFEQAQRDVVVAAEHLQEWASRWEDCKQSVLAFVTDEYLTALKATECKLADADEVLRAFCDKVKLQQAAIAALEPAPEPISEPGESIGFEFLQQPSPTSSPSTDEGRSVPGAEEDAGTNSDVLAEFMKRAGATEWKGGECPLTIGTKCDLLCADGGILIDHVVAQRDFDDSYWSRSDGKYNDDIIAYRIISEPADETHTDDLLRHDEAEAADAKLLEDEPVSVLDNPELLAAVERAEATLRGDELLAQNPPIVPVYEASYVGLQDPELDAEFDAMREREKADKPKLHFSIFGERGNRKLEDVE
jgi:hypothetical protein